MRRGAWKSGVWRISVGVGVFVSAILGMCEAGGDLAFAAEYPTKSPQLIVGWAPGGSSDLTARRVAELIKDPLGRPMVVVNRTGSAGVLAANEVIKSAPDGYTVLLVKIGQAVLQIVRGTAPYRTEDLEPVAGLSASPILLVVRGDSKFKSLQDIIEASKAQPGIFRFGHSATGGAPHLAMELLVVCI